MTIPAMAPLEMLPPWPVFVGVGVELLLVGVELLLLGVGVAVDRSSTRQLICILWIHGEIFMREEKGLTFA